MAKPVSFLGPAAMQKNPWGAVMTGAPSQAALNQSINPVVGMEMPSEPVSPIAMTDQVPMDTQPALSKLQQQMQKTVGENQQYVDAASQLSPVQEQQRRLASLDALNAEAMGSVPVQEDLSPLLGLIDTYTGSKLAGNYQKPMNAQDRANMLMGGAQRTQAGHEALLKDTLAQGKALQTDAFQEQRHNQDLAKEGYILDENGNLTIDPKGKAAATMADMAAQARVRDAQAKYFLTGKQNNLDFTKNTQLEKQANQIHSRVIQRLQGDPAMKQRLNQYTNLQNALSNFENAEHPTAQSFDELQQAVRSNLGIKGGSAVGERERTTMNSLGLDAARMTQLLTGNPQDIEKNTGLAKHMKDLVALEQRNIQGQTKRHLNTLSQGHGSMYAKYPELKQDLEDAVGAFSGEFAPLGSGTQPGATAPGLQLGQIVDGHAYLGGDPAKPESWQVQ